MARKEKRKKYHLDCYKDSPVPHYIEVIEGTEKQLDKAVEELTRKGFNVVIKNFNQEELLMSKETKTEKKKVGEKLEKSQVKTKFSGKHKPQLSGAVERKCAICGRISFSAWAFTKVGKKTKRKGTEKLTQKDFICRDSKTCKEKK